MLNVLHISLLIRIIVDFVEQVNIRSSNIIYSLSLQCCTIDNPKIRRFYLSASFRSRYCHTILIMKHDVPFLSSHSSISPPDLLQVGEQNGFLVLIYRRKMCPYIVHDNRILYFDEFEIFRS